MAQIIFSNPNSPEQPAKGIYRWFYHSGDKEITIYVGCAGNRRRSVGAPSTLKRGIQEAQRSCVSSDKGEFLDTDFIVGTALRFLKAQGYDCIWQHVSDSPADERAFCHQYLPLLQPKGTTIDSHFRLAKGKGQPWRSNDMELAERELLKVLGPRIQPTAAAAAKLVPDHKE